MIRKLLVRIVAAGSNMDDVLKAIEEEALLLHKTYIGEDYEAQSGVLLSLWMGSGNKGRRQLLQVEQGLVSPVSEGFLGTGQSVARAMSAELFTSTMTIEQTALMTALILAEAKTYGYGVGKESQILILKDTGSWNVFPNDPYRHSSIVEIEEDYSSLKRALRLVLLLHADLGAEYKPLESSLESFSKVVLANRKKRGDALARRIEADIERGIEETEDHSDEEPEDSGV